jgi:hypothetical protein
MDRAQFFVLGFFVLLVQVSSLNLEEETQNNTTLSKSKVSADEKGRKCNFLKTIVVTVRCVYNRGLKHAAREPYVARLCGSKTE